MPADPVVDRDEYGRPVEDRYRRLGAAGEKEEGLYVRFEPGFGLNVHIGRRTALYDNSWSRRPTHYEDRDGIVLGIGGWEHLCSLVGEWRAREAALSGRTP